MEKQLKKEPKVTEYLICRKDRYLAKSEVKHIQTILGKKYFNQYLRVEKLADYIYTIRYKKECTIEEAKVIKTYIEKNNLYKVYIRNKSYAQIKKEQQKISEAKQSNYQSKRNKVEADIREALQKARKIALQEN